MRALESLEPVHRYLDLKAEAERIAEEMNSLKPLLAAALVDEPEERFVTRGHEFTLGRRTTFTYSDDVKHLETAVKGMKQAERDDGVAEFKRATIFPVVKRVPARAVPATA